MNDQGSEDVRFDLEVSRNLTNDLKKQLRKVKKEMLDLRQAKRMLLLYHYLQIVKKSLAHLTYRALRSKVQSKIYYQNDDLHLINMFHSTIQAIILAFINRAVLYFF